MWPASYDTDPTEYSDMVRSACFKLDSIDALATTATEAYFFNELDS